MRFDPLLSSSKRFAIGVSYGNREQSAKKYVEPGRNKKLRKQIIKLGTK